MAVIDIVGRRLRGARRIDAGARAGPTAIQFTVATALGAALITGLWAASAQTLAILHALVVVGFAVSASSKLALAAIGRRPPQPTPLRRDRLPRYTIIVALYREAPVVRQLIAALSAIDYPRDRLQAILVLEPDDTETLGALAWLRLPPFVEVLINPSPTPRTKPNALNAALPLVRGEHLVIYDAEDRPDPGQLREAAARFAVDRRLSCLQAPLRVSNAHLNVLSRQFALEYAGQFDAVILGLARIGWPFPLGGTSNHFRTAELRQLGGWDAYNVTEDADLGFRLGAAGHKLGALRLATLEDAPTSFDDWLPQRTRWVKGYMQTWGVHMRRPAALGPAGMAALQTTTGVAILGAALHGPLVMLLIASALTDALGGWTPWSLLADFSVLACGWAAAVTANLVGARRAGISMTLLDALASLAYWPLQSLAFMFAVKQLVTAPHHWDKTAHTPTGGVVVSAAPLDATRPWSVSPAA